MNAQSAIEKVLQDFTKELLKVFSEAVVQAVSQVGEAGRAAIPAATASAAAPKRAARKAPAKAASPAKPARAAKGGGAFKSTPDQVNRLSDRILEVLRKSSRNLASKEIMKAAGLRATDEGRFQYALNKLKEDGAVQQHGERRQARYGVGAGSKAKAKHPRAPRARAAAPAAAVTVEAPVAEPAPTAE